MPLRLIPKRDPEPAEAVRTAVKRMPRPDGMLQCPRCGGRSTLRIENGAVVKNGRRKRGTVIEDDICAVCWKRDGTRIDMKTGNERPERVK